jgi:hypothetical protein
VKWVEWSPSAAAPRLAVPLGYSRPEALGVLAPRHLKLVKTVLSLSGYGGRAPGILNVDPR